MNQRRKYINIDSGEIPLEIVISVRVVYRMLFYYAAASSFKKEQYTSLLSDFLENYAVI